MDLVTVDSGGRERAYINVEFSGYSLVPALPNFDLGFGAY